MVRKISVTKAELAALRFAAAENTDLVSLLVKAEAAHAPPPKSVGISVKAFEEALLRTGSPKVVSMGRLAVAGYIRMQHDLAERKVTVEQAAAVGAWIRRQQWLRDTVTAEGVLRKWGDWAGQATAGKPVQRRQAPAPLEVPRLEADGHAEADADAGSDVPEAG